MSKRSSGILLHISSLPSPHGIGDFGPEAFGFADFLKETGQSLWQILPLNPISTSHGNSPYSSFSAFAGNPLFISPDILVRDGLLDYSDIEGCASFPSERVRYKDVTGYKDMILRKAFGRYIGKIGIECQFERFCNEQAHWLDDYALFVALKEQFAGAAWSEWPPELRDRDGDALAGWEKRLRNRVLIEKFLQYLFFKQWFSLKGYCNERNIKIIGDLPIYVCHDSCDVWTNPSIFKLDGEKKPTHVSGVPPDYFSETGQLWGTPVYAWDVLKEAGYSWWIRRLDHNLKLFDVLRLDHFRGYVAYWEVPSPEKTAVSGRWVEIPAHNFFDTLLGHFPSLPVIAEDLGVITPDVREVMKMHRFPGMKLLVFAFCGDISKNPYIPHNITKNSLVYTGTHDNNTIRGWFNGEASPQEKGNIFRYLGREVNEEDVSMEFIRLAMMSIADTAIIPMQDVLGIGDEGRMNTPSTATGNWEWRLDPVRITPLVKERLSEMTVIYGRI